MVQVLKSLMIACSLALFSIPVCQGIGMRVIAQEEYDEVHERTVDNHDGACSHDERPLFDNTGFAQFDKSEIGEAKKVQLNPTTEPTRVGLSGSKKQAPKPTLDTLIETDAQFEMKVAPRALQLYLLEQETFFIPDNYFRPLGRDEFDEYKLSEDLAQGWTKQGAVYVYKDPNQDANKVISTMHNKPIQIPAPTELVKPRDYQKIAALHDEILDALKNFGSVRDLVKVDFYEGSFGPAELHALDVPDDIIEELMETCPKKYRHTVHYLFTQRWSFEQIEAMHGNCEAVYLHENRKSEGASWDVFMSHVTLNDVFEFIDRMKPTHANPGWRHDFREAFRDEYAKIVAGYQYAVYKKHSSDNQNVPPQIDELVSKPVTDYAPKRVAEEVQRAKVKAFETTIKEHRTNSR